jgi:hypothetical protein
VDKKQHRPIFSLPIIVAMIILFLFGCFLLAISGETSWKDIGKELGILFVSVTPVVILYEAILRWHMRAEMAITTTEAVKESLPDSYKNIMKYGITDLYDGLTVGTLRSSVEQTSAGAVITVNNIYIPDFKFGFKYESIFIDAIKLKHCALNIVLCDMEATDLLQRRADSTAFSSLSEYQLGIKNNLDFLHSIWLRLDNAGQRDKISVRLHDNFISIPSWGFGDSYIIGNYLFGRSAVQGIQIKIKKDTLDGKSELFRDIEQNFTLQWKRAHKEVVFSEKGYTVQKRVPG